MAAKQKKNDTKDVIPDLIRDPETGEQLVSPLAGSKQVLDSGSQASGRNDKKNNFRKSNTWKLLRRLLEVAIIVLAAFYIGREIIDNKRVVLDHLSDLNWWLLFFAWLAYLGYFFVRSIAWRQIMFDLGADLKLFPSVKIWFLSEFSRYIPGNVWSFLGRVYLAEKKGIAKKVTAASLAVEMIFLVGSTAIFAAIYLPLMPYQVATAYRWLFLLVIPAVILLLTPSTLQRIINKMLKLMKKEPIEFKFSSSKLSIVLLLFTLAWAFYGLGSYLTMAAIVGVSKLSVLWLISTFVVAWLIGYASIITPMGLGVREGAVVAALAPVITDGLASLVAIFTRVWLMVSELSVLALIFLFDFIRSFRRRR